MSATEIDDEGETLFELDSVFGEATFNLRLYESNYFLRDFQPSGDLNEPQVYYSNKSTGSSTISDGILEGTLIRDLSPFFHDKRQIVLKDIDGEITGRQVPAIRVPFLPSDTDGAYEYWKTKIFDLSGEPEISNQSNLNDYFRGLYFKAETLGGFTDSSLALLNLDSTNANLIFYYTRDNTIPDSDPVQSEFTLNFAATRVNFMENEFTLSSGDQIQGDEQLFLKGGEGASAIMRLFDGGNVDFNDGVVNSFEIFKNEFVEMDEDGNFVRSKKLVNEANLVIYVDQDAVVNIEEPDRIYLFDTKNNSPLIDYFFDTANTLSPTDSRINHLGKLERDDNGRGVRYKIRITEHINNLLVRDSTNIDLGLVVSGNINLESNAQDFDVLNPEDDNDKLPVSSIVTPRGTVLFGNNTTEEEKKLYLEIFFTEPNN
ncbi:MAG: DUF4270 domain-containing protein [Psychroserpens sp.]|nr:DUF4270 domain-containing protein [Psychroserpens sp.]